MRRILFKLFLVLIVFLLAPPAYAANALDYLNMGKRAYNERNYSEAIRHYEKAAALFENSGDRGTYATTLNIIGMIYRRLDQYDKAVEYYSKSLTINEELKRDLNIAMTVDNLGQVYYEWGKYDKALECYSKSLAKFEKLGQKIAIAMCMNSIGMVYKAWGNYDRAVESYRKALAINEELGDKAKIAVSSYNIAEVYYAWGQYDRVLEYLRKNLAIAEELGNKNNIASALNGIGMVYNAWGQYDKAIEYYKRALGLDEGLNKKADIATLLNNMGMAYHSMGQDDQSFESLRKALAIEGELGRKDAIATILNNFGLVYYDSRDYRAAIPYFEKSVTLKDELRQTAKGDIRRDYLASQIYTYRFLAASYFLYGSFRFSFNAVEAANSKYLVEQMQGKLGTNLENFDVENYGGKIPLHTVVVNFADMEQDDFLVFAIDRGGLYGAVTDMKEFISSIPDRYKASIEKATERTRGLILKEKRPEKGREIAFEKEKKEKRVFDKIIDYYRQLLSKSDPTSEGDAARREIAQKLYKLFFSGIEKQLTGKTDLVIIPGGVLAFVPFESLIMPDGHYLTERFNIKYIQSLTVSGIIEKRQYAPDRKPIIAFGGAVYDEGRYAVEMITNEAQLKYSLLALNRGEDARSTYAGLGYSWTNLPGTLAEVKAIKSTFDNAVVYTGENVTKARFRKLSKEGELGKYRAIHIATHGLVVPEAPDLSAVVFSQLKAPMQGDDGYLRAGEILDSDLRADFVNLSACETGLGKVYSGEGLVGLTQSFLVAGANGLSVSLWQVSDESTTEFMVGLYKLIKEKGLSYDRAMTEMRRKFINHPKWSSPYFWSPFVYYGR